MKTLTKQSKCLVWILAVVFVLACSLSLSVSKPQRASADVAVDETLSKFGFTGVDGITYENGTITISNIATGKYLDFWFYNGDSLFDADTTYTLSMDVTRDAESYSTFAAYVGDWKQTQTKDLNPTTAETVSISISFKGGEIVAGGNNKIGFQLQTWTDGVDATVSNIKIVGPKTVQFVQKDINSANTQLLDAPYESGFVVSNQVFTADGVLSATVNSTVGWSNFIWIPIDNSALSNGETYSLNLTYSSNMGVNIVVNGTSAYVSFNGISGEKTISCSFAKGNGDMANIVIEAFPTVGTEGTFTLKNMYYSKDIVVSAGAALGTLPTVPEKAHYNGVWKIDGAEINAETVLTDGMGTVARAEYVEVEHALTLVEGQPANCLQDGWEDYYACSACGKNYLLNAGETLGADGVIALDKVTEIVDVEAWKTGDGKIEKGAHSYGDLIPEVSATCSATGTLAHKDCSICGKHFDADGVEIADLTIALINHTYEKVEEVAATAEADGVKEHYTCSSCDKLFILNENEEYVEVNAEDLVIAKVARPTGCFGSVSDGVLIATLLAFAVVVAIKAKKRA